jgi:hypothetical protein
MPTPSEPSRPLTPSKPSTRQSRSTGPQLAFSATTLPSSAASRGAAASPSSQSWAWAGDGEAVRRALKACRASRSRNLDGLVRRDRLEGFWIHFEDFVDEFKAVSATSVD